MADMRTQNNGGFTLIEVIAVLVVLSIVSVVFATRLIGTDTELIAAADVIKTHLRYAQARAMSSNVIWGIDFKGNTYAMFKNKNGDATVDADEAVALPGEDFDTISLPSGISATEIVAFDSWGKPCSDAGAGTPYSADNVITIGTLSITITKNTGFIQ